MIRWRRDTACNKGDSDNFDQRIQNLIAWRRQMALIQPPTPLGIILSWLTKWKSNIAMLYNGRLGQYRSRHLQCLTSFRQQSIGLCDENRQDLCERHTWVDMQGAREALSQIQIKSLGQGFGPAKCRGMSCRSENGWFGLVV